MSFNRKWLDVYPEIPRAAKRSDRKKPGVPDGPRTRMLGGSLKDLALYGPKFFLDLQKEYGESASFYINGKFFIALFDPDMVYEVYVTKQKSFIKGVIFRKIRMMLGDALLTSERPVHLKHKRMIQPSFHKNRIENYLEIMFDLTKSQTKEWGKEEKIELYPELFRLTLKIVSQSLFGLDSEKYEERMFKSSTISSNMSARLTLFNFVPFFKYLSIPLIRKYKKASDDLDSLTMEIIEERRGKDSENDLLDMLLMAQDTEGNGFSQQEVRDEALGLLLAGHETTAVTLTWAMMWLSSNPSSLNKIKEEAKNQKWIQEDRPPTMKEIMETSYVDNVINETLRVSSPSWINMKQAVEDVYIKDVFIPKGTHVITSQYVTHRNKEYYSDPMRWKPERWENNFQSTLPNGAYFPFALGPRRCIGDQFAMVEMKILLLMLAHDFDWESAEGSKRIPQIDSKVTLRPKGTVPILIKRNHDSML
jgi:cytochrome P450